MSTRDEEWKRKVDTELKLMHKKLDDMWHQLLSQQPHRPVERKYRTYVPEAE